VSDVALAAACEAAYADPVTWERGNAHVLLAESEGRHVVAFRGTANARDWLVDFEASPKLHPGLGWCHAGFLDDVLGVADQMRADLAGERVVVTGHSKGGAEALIFAGLLVLAGQAPEAVVTFGAPRAAFATLGEVLDQVPVRQYRHGNDPVPLVPLELAGWRHAREPLLQIGQPCLDPIADHFIAGYRKALGP
jgi:hypothetical protein